MNKATSFPKSFLILQRQTEEKRNHRPAGRGDFFGVAHWVRQMLDQMRDAVSDRTFPRSAEKICDVSEEFTAQDA
jgi:hypothetical protein